jgi:cytoskeletal protein CcmA (bactofilin family)
MFSKTKEYKGSRVDTILGKNFVFKGEIESAEGSLRIDGNFEGELQVSGDVLVGETGKVTGSLNARNITIAGQVNGKIEAGAKLELTPTAKVCADAKMVFLSIEEGAFYQGLCEPQIREDQKKRIIMPEIGEASSN